MEFMYYLNEILSRNYLYGRSSESIFSQSSCKGPYSPFGPTTTYEANITACTFKFSPDLIG